MKLSNISPRVSQILQILLEQNAPISVKALAEQMNLSKRTIQREMDSVNTILKGYEITLNSKTGVGIWLEGSEDKNRNCGRICRWMTVWMSATVKNAGSV